MFFSHLENFNFLIKSKVIFAINIFLMTLIYLTLNQSYIYHIKLKLMKDNILIYFINYTCHE